MSGNPRNLRNAASGMDSNQGNASVSNVANATNTPLLAASYGATSDVSNGSSAFDVSRKRRKKRKRAIIAAIVVVVALLLGSATAAFAYVFNLNSTLHSRVDENLLAALVPTDTPGDPFYMLLMGTDGSAERRNSAEYANDAYRSDSIMLTRIDPKNRKVTLISIPRDTQVEIEGHGTQKINAAHAFGGPALAVQTVSKLAGVPISHYAEIDFDGFAQIVDELGGVEVNVPMEVNDDNVSAHVDAGLHVLNGQEALSLCRSRHNYDDYGSGDLYREATQRLVLSAIAQKILESDAITISNSVNTLVQYATTDLDVAEIINIARSMHGLDAQTDVFATSAPSTSKVIGGIWYEIMDMDALRSIISRVNRGLPPTEDDVVDAATGIVLSSTGDESGSAHEAFNKQYYQITKNAHINVRNGNGKDGVCSEVSSILDSMGYIYVNTGNANSFNFPETLVVYKGSSNKAEAEQIAQMLGTAKAIEDDNTFLFDSDFLIVVGADWPA